jgi:hypothetical protein
LWTCADCGRPFARPKHPHSCVRATVEEFLAGRTDAERALFEALRAACPGTLAPAKTRVGFQRERIHAAANGWGRGALRAHVVLRRRVDDPRFRIEPVGDVFVHHFVLRAPEDADDALRALLREAYETYG